jgi:hypothetical protein
MGDCLPFRDWDLVAFEKGKGHKKYRAVFESKNGRQRVISFGDTRYEHYRDSTDPELGGGLWTHLDHLDRKRRTAYRRRHQKDNLDCWSPGYLSWCYLW